jgi:uroporphyrinogen decarboxylase
LAFKGIVTFTFRMEVFPINKKERVIAAVRGQKIDYIPAGLWMHFPAQMHHGVEAVKAHIKFYRETGTDILKVMNENLMPLNPIAKADDWKHIKPISLNSDYVKDQLEIIKRVKDEIKDEAVILATIHGVVASAFHSCKDPSTYDTEGGVLQKHLQEKPQIVGNAFRILAEGLAQLSQACIEAGADGIYYAALGGETYRFTDEEFYKYIKPNDLYILDAVSHVPGFNVLHMCKDRLNLSRYKDYPTEVVNWSVHADNPPLTDADKLFPGKAVLGGLDSSAGPIVSGTLKDIEKEVQNTIDSMKGFKFILGGDCTLPTGIPYERIRKAIETSRN